MRRCLLLNVKVVVSNTVTEIFNDVIEPINDIVSLTNAHLKLIIKKDKKTVIAVFNEWIYWRQIE